MVEHSFPGHQPPPRELAGDMARHISCMQAAADAGLAPRIRYSSVEDRISFTDFVETVPFPATEALRRVPAALRILHALPPFPTVPFNTTCTLLLNKGPEPGRIPPEVQGRKHPAGARTGGTLRSIRAGGDDLLISLSGPGAES